MNYLVMGSGRMSVGVVNDLLQFGNAKSVDVADVSRESLDNFVVLGSWVVVPQAETSAAVPILPLDQVTNTEAIGLVLYTDYIYLFQASGLVLLVAMVGAIVLTLRQRPGVRRQKISAQLARKPGEAIEVVKVTTGSGI